MSSEANKRIAKNTAMLYVRQLFSMVVSLFTAGIVLRTLGVEDYGIYSVVGGIVSLFGFLQGAMVGTTQRFINVEMGKGSIDKLRNVFSTSLTIHIGIAVIIFILAETVGLWFINSQLVIPDNRMVAANWVYQFSIFSAMLTITQSPYTALIIANEKMDIYGYLGIAEALMRLIALYLLLTINIDKLILYSLFGFVVNSMFIFIYRAYCMRKFCECHFVIIKDVQLYKKMLSFSSWNLFGNIAGVAMTQGQNILLNIFFGPVVNAARAVAVNVNGAIGQFISNFMLAMNPQITKLYVVGQVEESNKLIFRGARFSFYLYFILASPVLIKTPELLKLWLGTPPEYSTLFCRLALIDALIMCLSHPIIVGVSATGEIKRYQAIVGGILLLNIPISYLLFKLNFPSQTIYFVAISLSVFSFIARLFIADRLLKFGKIKFIKDVFLRCWTIFFIAIPIEFLVSKHLPESTMFVLIVMGISVFISSIVVFTVGISREERHFIISIVKKLNFDKYKK